MASVKMNRIRALAGGLLGVAVLWVLSVWAVRGVGSLEPTAGDLRGWLEDQSYQTLEGKARREYLEEYAKRINQLSLDERRAMREEPLFERSFQDMNPSERRDFVEATLPRGMRQMMQAINEMDRDERERLVRRALRDLEDSEDEEIESRLEEDDSRRIIESGLQTYYEEASAQSRLQLAPLMEQLQQRLQGTR